MAIDNITDIISIALVDFREKIRPLEEEKEFPFAEKNYITIENSPKK